MKDPRKKKKPSKYEENLKVNASMDDALKILLGKTLDNNNDKKEVLMGSRLFDVKIHPSWSSIKVYSSRKQSLFNRNILVRLFYDDSKKFLETIPADLQIAKNLPVDQTYFFVPVETVAFDLKIEIISTTDGLLDIDVEYPPKHE
jgi:hypothetical protein